MKILEEDYKEATSPLNKNSKVSLCEEETIIFDKKLKREIKFTKLFLLCNSSGVRFSNTEIEKENIRRMKEEIKRKRYDKQKPTTPDRPTE